MKQLMEYKIISGRVVETRRSWLSVRQAGEPVKRRAARVAGATSEKKIKANEISSSRELARRINAVFLPGDALVTPKYVAEHLPSSYEEAEDYLKKALRQYRKEFKKAYGRSPKMVWVTANWSPSRNAPARLHHHIVVEAEGVEMLRRLWQGGGMSIEFLDNRGDHSDLAAYMVANVHGRPAKKKWHCSRGLADEIIYTEPVPVEDVEDVRPEKDAVIKEHETSCDEDGHVTSSYLRCVLAEKPKVRGGKIVMPKSGKRQTASQPSAAKSLRKGGAK